jgi:hypothetical protein
MPAAKKSTARQKKKVETPVDETARLQEKVKQMQPVYNAIAHGQPADSPMTWTIGQELPPVEPWSPTLKLEWSNKSATYAIYDDRKNVWRPISREVYDFLWPKVRSL